MGINIDDHLATIPTPERTNRNPVTCSGGDGFFKNEPRGRGLLGIKGVLRLNSLLILRRYMRNYAGKLHVDYFCFAKIVVFSVSYGDPTQFCFKSAIP